MISKYPKKIILYKKKNNILNFFDYYLSDGRSSLEYGISLYNLQGTSILVPEYICEEVIETLKNLKMKIIYYSINKMLEPEYKEILKQINQSVRSIIFVNYFGLPISINRNILFAKNNKLIMIEDNAHGFSGVFENKLLGTNGDIGFTSPRKNLNILSGGLLYIKNKELKRKFNFVEKKITFKWRIYRYVPLFIFNIFNIFIFNIKYLLKKKSENISQNIHKNSKFYKIDYISKNIIKFQNYKKNNLIKKKIFNLWFNFLNDMNFDVITCNKLNNFSPMCIAFYINSNINQKSLLNLFRSLKIEAYTWPDLPEEINVINNNAYNLKNNIICIPITTDNSLNYIKAKINEISRVLNDRSN